MYRSQVMICGVNGCTSSGGDKVAAAFEAEVKAAGLENEVKLVRTGCFGMCAMGPIVVVYPEGAFYVKLKAENVKEIVDEHLKNGRPVTKYLYNETVAEDGSLKDLDQTSFYKNQVHIGLRNLGKIDPENIDEYIDQIHEANGLTKVINLSTNIAALTVYFINGQVVLPLGLIAGCMNVAGNYLGATKFTKGGTKVVKPIMVLVIVIFFVKVLGEVLGQR